jgi:hypothetical protein
MPLCTCKKCLILTNGTGRNLHRTTVARHTKNEQSNQYLLLEDELDQNFQNSEEENLFEEPEEQILDNEERSPMEISDNEEEIPIEKNLTDETPIETFSSFQNEENEEINYENIDHYYENDNLIYDSQSEFEFDNENSNADDEGEFLNKLVTDIVNILVTVY